MIKVSDICRIATVFLIFLAVFMVAKPALAAETFYTIDRVNLRGGPSTEDAIIKTLPIGIELEVIEYDPANWSKVIYNDMIGFMKSEYIGVTKPENAPPVSPSGVVLMEWSEARNVVQVGAPIAVYDVYSGLTYYVKSFSNGMHADVEPITTDDTDIMKRTYGGSWSWDPRPVWVTIGDTTIAAAINGMPHGGGVNGNNGMDGQVCLHFKGSSVHNGNRTYNNDMQWAVQVSFNASK